MKTRVCGGCLQRHPLTQDFFKKDPACSEGFRSTCRACASEKRRNWYSKTREVRVEQLRAFHVRNPEARKTYEDNWEGRDPFTRRATIIFHGAKKHAAQKGVPFDPLLTSSMIREWLLRESHCPCCGQAFYIKQKPRNHEAPTLDRFDSSKGYTLDNISLICWRCNRVKCDATIEELEMVLLWMKSKIGG